MVLLGKTGTRERLRQRNEINVAIRKHRKSYLKTAQITVGGFNRSRLAMNSVLLKLMQSLMP